MINIIFCRMVLFCGLYDRSTFFGKSTLNAGFSFFRPFLITIVVITMSSYPPGITLNPALKSGILMGLLMISFSFSFQLKSVKNVKTSFLPLKKRCDYFGETIRADY